MRIRVRPTFRPASSRSWARRAIIAQPGDFLTTFWDKDSKSPKLPEDDEIIKGVMLTRGGAVVHPQFQSPQAA